MVQFTAIVLAAARGPDDPMAAAFGARHKCLVKVAGTEMIIRVLAALRAAPEIGEIRISIDVPETLRAAQGFAPFSGDRRVRILDSGQSVGESVERAVLSGGTGFPCLVTTADHALVTPEMIAHFCREALAERGDVAVGLAPETVIRAAYPDSVRTYLKFSDGRFSGCNLYALMNAKSLGAVRFWQKVERQRKAPWRLARTFGLKALFLYLSGRLTLAEAMAHGSSIIGARARAVIMPFAEAAIDVDRPADLALAEEIIAQGYGRGPVQTP